MPPACKSCGGPTVADDQGVVCLDCAEIAEPNRVILANELDFPISTTYDGWIPAGHHTIKTARNRYLSSLDKEARDGKHLEDMHHFIRNLAQASFVSGVTERAYNLFQKAMKLGKYRFGRTSKLVAGACISIALRSTNRPEMFPQLASSLGEKTNTLIRTFSSVVSLIKPDDFPSSEPKSHVSTLQAHLYAALDGSIESDLPLPPSFISAVKPLSASSISATANSLSDLIASSTPPSSLARLPVAPTACAVIIWAIEAEARTPITQLGEIAAFMGTKCNVKKAVVMSRYKVIQDELLERIEKIDWLEHYEPNGGKAGRAKVSRRLVVARGLKAAIEAEGERRRQRLLGVRPLSPHGEDSDASDGHSQDRPPRKRRRVTALRQATQFLLNPLSGPIPASQLVSSRYLSLSLPTYLLTSSSIHHGALPSRLQLLTAARGGVGSDEIADDELFEDDELERIMRSNDEVAELRNVLGWEEGAAEEELVKEPPRHRRRTAMDPKPTTSSRLNPAAIATFFADDKSDNEFGGLLQLDDEPGFFVEEDGDVTMGLHGVLDKTIVAQEDDDEDGFPRSPSPYFDEGYAQELN